MARVLYAGDDKLNSYHFFAGAESIQAFQRRIKDYEPLLSALEAAPSVEVEHMGGPEAMEGFPWSLEELAEYDVVLLSDFPRDTLLPHFMEEAVPGPNRVRLVRDFVESGGGLIYCGGWMTYQGYRGAGNWAHTPVADVLPVELRPVFDDRKERPEGGEWTVLETEHPVTSGLEWGSIPPVYGYNVTEGFTPAATPLAEVDGHPLLAACEHGEGRALAYTSDPGPKWGMGFLEWEGYPSFWEQAVAWAAGER